MLPTVSEINNLPDEWLNEIIEAGESINWEIRLQETQEEIDEYVECLYAERDKRDLSNQI